MGVAFGHCEKSSLERSTSSVTRQSNPLPYEAAPGSINAGVEGEKLYDDPSTGRPYQDATEATRERAKKVHDLHQAIRSLVRSPSSLPAVSMEFH
jgi:hypothetical protein